MKSPVFSSFLSTPSARRATVSHNDPDYLLRISIHALREEGDADLPPDHDHRTISIHALREEGDLSLSEARDQVRLISIHALREEGDKGQFLALHTVHQISIHALREEGDSDTGAMDGVWDLFLSTPSARRATNRLCVSIHL